MFKLEYTQKFIKQLKKIDKNTSERILSKILSLQEGYLSNNNVKHLTDYTPEYRLRIGDYRVLFDVMNDTIYIQELRTRKEGY